MSGVPQKCWQARRDRDGHAPGLILIVALLTSCSVMSPSITATPADWDQWASTRDQAIAHIPAGPFVMGSDTHNADERPQHLVYLSAFDMDRYEVANAQYRRFLEATGRPSPPYWSGNDYPPGQADYPVAAVSWPDAEAYCAWAGKRLPTEAEWEKACRGADARIYPWGDEWDERRANVDRQAGSARDAGLDFWDEGWAILRMPAATSKDRGLRRSGSLPAGASPYGIMDLVGNVSEWVSDWENWGGYWKVPVQDPQVSGPPWNRILRGSSWYDPNGSAAWVQDQSRCSARNSSHELRDPRVGFRCASSASGTRPSP